MRKLLASLAFVVIGFFIVDRVGGKLMWWAYQNTSSTICCRTRHIVGEVESDVLLLGSSRCLHHYVPSIISDSIGMSVYNCGFDGANIYSYYAVLNYVLSHHVPKTVCVDLYSYDYNVMDNPFACIHSFAPYIDQNSGVDEVFREDGSYISYQLSHLYRYNAIALPVLSRLFVTYTPTSELSNGYFPSVAFSDSHPTEVEIVHTTQNIDSLKLQYMQKFIGLCRSRDINLVFVVSPGYKVVDEDFYDVLKDIAHKNNVPFIDYLSARTYIDKPEYFRDAMHLNHEGATLYSSMFAGDLKKTLCQ